MRAERGELSGMKADDLIEYYVGSRAASTLSTSAAAYKRVWEYTEETGMSLFRWGEGEMMGMMIELGKEGAAENQGPRKVKLSSNQILIVCQNA